ncbi:Esterase [Arthrobotrys entomopaga]|nr:Esterase [Arthrobotrys entomopaga]
MYDTPESVLKLGEMDPQIASLSVNLPGVAGLDDLPKFRSMLDAFGKRYLAALGPTPAGLKEFEITIPFRDGATGTGLVCQPTQEGWDYPLIVLFYGGGFFMGNPAQLTGDMRTLAEKFSAVVISAPYRLAPEHPFPTPMTDAWDALLYITQNYQQYNASPEAGFIVGGISAGSTHVAVIGQKYVAENLQPKITGLWAALPFLFPDEEGSLVPEKYKHLWLSRNQIVGTPGLNKPYLEKLLGFLKPDFQSPLMTPFSPETNKFEGQPRTLVQVCGMDPVRDDGIIYAKVLKDSGVETRLHVYPGLGHGFWNAFPQLEASKKYHEDVIQGFTWLLQK